MGVFFWEPYTNPAIQRATGSIGTEPVQTVRVETASPSGYVFQQQGVNSEGDIVVSINRGELEAQSSTGDYFLFQEYRPDPSGSIFVDVVKLDNGGGVDQLQTVKEVYALTDEERAIMEANNAALSDAARANALAQSVPYATGTESESSSSFPQVPDNASVIEHSVTPESSAPVAVPADQSRTVEQGPVGGCETRIQTYTLDDGSTAQYEEHDDGGGSWRSIG